MQSITCCGLVCQNCEHYPNPCKGCTAEKGLPFWCLAFNNGETCKRYVCCVEEKKLEHCGQCGYLPCELYNVYDTRLTKVENELKLKKQLETLWLREG